jgi:hypothetical protein
MSRGLPFRFDRVDRTAGGITRPERKDAMGWIIVNDLVAVHLRFDGWFASGVIWLI